MSFEKTSSSTKYTIIYPPCISWNDQIYQRPHQLISEFAKQGYLSIFANKINDGKGEFWFKNENLCISNDIEKTLKNTEIKKKMEGSKVILWITYPPLISYKNIIKPDITVFDYIDEAKDEFASWKIKLDECMKNADIIFVTSKRLLSLVKPNYPEKTYIVPNGADIEQYFKNAILPSDLKSIKEKHECIVGFIGSLSTWLDIPLIKDMALSRPNWGFVFIGPKFCDLKDLEQIDNIYFLGPKNYNELVNYVKNFDAGIIPFQVRDMTNSSNPIKMYEYLAAGIPVVATPIDECLEFYAYVRTALNGYESVIKIEEAIKASINERENYLNIALENSWTKRVKYILDIFDIYFKKIYYIHSQKKLSIVTSNLFTNDGTSIILGGTERYTRDLAYLCRELGFDVTIHQFGNSYWEKKYEDFKVKAYPFKLNSCITVEEVMKNDLIKSDYILYMWIGFQKNYRPNSISICHGIWFDAPYSNDSLTSHAVSDYILPALKQLSALVTVDLNFLNFCRSAIPYADNSKIIYIPNYVDCDLFKPYKKDSDSIIEILYPRRYDKWRGIYIMQQIVPELLTKYPNIRFNFAIDKNNKILLEEWITWLKNQRDQQRIRFAHYDMDKMPEAYKSADIVVIPSICSEGTSLSALEAMAMGKAVVATNVGGLTNIIIPEFNGKLVNPDICDIKHAIEEYINSPAERSLHGQRACETARASFNKKRWEKQWTELILSIYK